MGSVASYVARAFPSSLLMLKSTDAIHDAVVSTLEQIWGAYRQGHLLLEEGHPEEAIRQFKLCLALNRFFGVAWHGLADAYHQIGYLEEADRYRKTARKVTRA
jgi:Flp pilus assembly protein TadD